MSHFATYISHMANSNRTRSAAENASDALASSGLAIPVVAERTGIPANALADKISGKTELTLDDVYLLARETGLPPSRFVPTLNIGRAATVADP